MAAILDPRSHPCTPPTTSRVPARSSRPPRHLSAVATAPRLVPGPAVERPASPHGSTAAAPEALLTPSMVAAAVAAVVLAVVVALGIGGGAFTALVPTPGAEPVAASAATVVVVEPGDSIWSIARSVQPQGDVRPLVHRIIQANGSGPLLPGQELVVPR